MQSDIKLHYSGNNEIQSIKYKNNYFAKVYLF